MIGVLLIALLRLRHRAAGAVRPAGSIKVGGVHILHTNRFQVDIDRTRMIGL